MAKFIPGAKKKLTAAQILAIRKKPISQRTISEVRMIKPNAVNRMGHTQAEVDKYRAGAKAVNEMRAAAKKKPKLRMEKSAAGTKPAQRKDTRSPAIKKRK
jgi:hypothetical protein